jgi:hypothetical protein
MPAAAIPTVDGMFSVWRADRCVQDASAHNYIRWIKWFRFYVNCLGLEERAQLTQEGACRFAEWYGRHRRVDHKKMARAQTALHALNRVYEVMGLHPPKWSAPRPLVRPASALLQEYADYLARHRGSPAVTVQKRLTHVGRLLEHLADRDKTWWRSRTLTTFWLTSPSVLRVRLSPILPEAFAHSADFCWPRGGFLSRLPIRSFRRCRHGSNARADHCHGRTCSTFCVR